MPNETNITAPLGLGMGFVSFGYKYVRPAGAFIPPPDSHDACFQFLYMEKIKRVELTPAAAEVIVRLRKTHGPLMFHQSGGCCDGSAPMCFPEGEFITGNSDVLLGYIHDCPFYMSADQYEYWKHTHLTVDVVPGRGASFSLEIPLGLRFLVRSRLLTDEEYAALFPKIG